MKILITNIMLNNRTGTELYVRDLALTLLKRGHSPVVYTPAPGMIADEIRDATIPVVDDLDNIAFVPDIIHGHHLYETVTALLKYPNTPAVFLCHDWGAWHDVPPKFSRLRRYIPVDEACRDRLICENAIAEEKVRQILNFVDTKRFLKRAALPVKPVRALIFSNYAKESSYIEPVRQACAIAGIELDVVGAGVGKQTDSPESIIGQYDLVFAKAKAAIEAMAVGTAVILSDSRGLGGMVTMENVRQLRQLNFGRRSLTEKIDTQNILEQIKKYNDVDAEAVSQFMRANASMEDTVTNLIEIYEEVIAEQKSAQAADRDEEYAEIYDFFRTIRTGAFHVGPLPIERTIVSPTIAAPAFTHCAIAALKKMGVYKPLRAIYRLFKL